MAAACVCLVAMGEPACDGRVRREGRAKSTAAPAAPRVVCDAAVHDFGRILQGDRPAHVFRIRNAGSAPLHIAGVGRAYSCSAPKPPSVVAAGEGTDLEVICDTDERATRLVDKVAVHTDDPLSPDLWLEVQASIEPLLVFASRTVDSAIAFGETDTKEDGLAGRLATSARLRVEESDPRGPEVTVVAATGAPQALRFRFSGKSVGHGAGQTVVATGLEKPARLTVLWSCDVRGDLVVEPTNPYIDLRAPAPVGVAIHVSSKRRDFRLERTVVTEGPFEAAFARVLGGTGDPIAYSVDVRVRASVMIEGERGIAGKLRLVSNDPAEPRKDVPLFALGAIDQSAH